VRITSSVTGMSGGRLGSVTTNVGLLGAGVAGEAGVPGGAGVDWGL
jgi:hypothetical protein